MPEIAAYIHDPALAVYQFHIRDVKWLVKILIEHLFS